MQYQLEGDAGMFKRKLAVDSQCVTLRVPTQKSVEGQPIWWSRLISLRARFAAGPADHGRELTAPQRCSFCCELQNRDTAWKIVRPNAKLALPR